MFNVWKFERKKNDELKVWISSSILISVCTIQLPTVHVCIKFQPSRLYSFRENLDTRYICPLSTCVPSFSLQGLTISEKSVTKNFNVWKLERKKNEEMKGRIRVAAWFQYTRYIHPLSTCVTSFNLLGLTVPEKCVRKMFNAWKMERKKNDELKGWISSSILISVYTIQLPTVHVCMKFQPSRPLSFRKKKRYTINLPTVHVCTKFQSSRPHSFWEMCVEKV